MYIKETLFLLSILESTHGVDLSSSAADDNLPNTGDLLPPEGKIWRGSTMQPSVFGAWSGVDPYLFEEMYHEPLSIMRTFRTSSNTEITTEAEWIRNGGILFYSI